MDTNVKRRKKASAIIGNIILIVALIFIALIAVMRATSYKKGYNNIFGTAFMAVKTNSMQGDKKDNFKKGAMIFVDVLSEEEKSDLASGEVRLENGTIVTFRYYNKQQKSDMIITHRIIGYRTVGASIYYIAAGDYNPSNESQEFHSYDIIGFYKGNAAALGYPTLLLEDKWGFFCIVLIPCFLLIIYCGFKVIRSLKSYRMEKAGINPEINVIDAIAQKENELKRREEELAARLKLLEKMDTGREVRNNLDDADFHE